VKFVGFGVCRTTVVDERSEVIFFDFSEGVATATNFLLTVFPHICRAISPKRHEIAIHRMGQKTGPQTHDHNSVNS